MNVEITQVHLVILFAILFISLGWIAPAAYASYAPQDSYIEVHEFSATDTTTAAESHTVFFDRTVHSPNTATIFTELYLISEDDTRVEVDTRQMERYFQEGSATVVSDFPLPDSIVAGEYRYVMVVEMDLVQGRIIREFVFTSESFTVAKSDTVPNNTLNTSNC